ncbi:MAG: hypothetical protein KDD69_15250, partial [Bdellovibrionales bacterium]|nr:hypothetical protein [Bdellovibrionales bacterium]
TFGSSPINVLKASVWGMSFPWQLTVSSLLGVVCMTAPSWFGIDIHTTAADLAHLGGALILTVSVISMAEVLRLCRIINILLAIAVATCPWFLQGSPVGFQLFTSAVGSSVLLLSIPRGVVTETYGSWDRFVR